MFLNPLMLAWAVGAAVPVLVHLLSQSRYRTVEWGAMMFLDDTAGPHHRRSRLKQWTLLAVRSAMVGLLAVAAARPVFAGRFASLVPTAGLSTGGRATVMLIVDDSASMGYTLNGRSRLDQARAISLQILSGLHRGDSAALVLAGGPQDSSAEVPVSDFQNLASKITDLSPGYGEADFADALEHAATILERAETADREIYVVCDRQASSWRRAISPAFTDAWATRRSAANAPRVTIFPVGGYESDNLSVETVRVLNPPVIRDQPAELEVRVRNLGTSVADAVPLSVWTGRLPLGDTTVSVDAGAARRVRMTARFPEAGSRVISAAIKTGGYTADDRFDRSVQVVPPVRVLLIDGDDAGDADASSSSRALRLALAPFAASGQQGADPATVTIATPDRLTTETLAETDVVVLCDISAFTSEQVRNLEQFVYRGGGVWFVPGRRVSADEFNQTLYREGAGIFPASIQPPTPPDAPLDAGMGNVDRQHPVFGFLDSGPAPQWRVRRVFPAVPRVPDARVIAMASTGQPLLIETTAGRGRALMSTTAFDPAWTDAPASSLFLPFAQSVVRYLSAGLEEDRNLSISQPISVNVPGSIDDRTPTVQLMPSGRRERATVRRFADHSEIRYFRTDSPGTYRLRYLANHVEQTMNFVVGRSRTESDLTPVSDDQWRSFRRKTGITRIEPAATPVADAVNHQRGGREVWIDLVGVVLMLGLVELAMTRCWSSTGDVFVRGGAKAVVYKP